MALRKDPYAFTSGALALAVHGLVLMILVINFQTSPSKMQASEVAEVTLWDHLPTPKVKVPEIKPVEEVVPPKMEPKPEPVQEVKPPEPKVDIVLKKTKPQPPTPDPAIKLEEEKRAAEKLKQEKAKLEQQKQAELKKLQQMLAAEDHQLQNDAQSKESQQVKEAGKAQGLEPSGKAIREFTAKIQAKIRSKVNRQACGSDPQVTLTFLIHMMPTGEVAGSPRLVAGSGSTACDQAVERAILQAQPLPIPLQPELFDQFRDLNLLFKPNETN